jgi:hypothetical protein
MRKISILFITFVSFLAFANCYKAQYRDIPLQPIQLKNVDYTVAGTSSAKVCQNYFLIFMWGSGGERYASVDNGYYGNLEAKAMYDALNKLDKADALVSPKFDYIVNDNLIFGDVCVTVTAKGVTYK